MLILLLFFFSGATALIYEVVWSKYLTLMFGSTVQAQTVVLSVFMGGLALGNRLFGRRADDARQPLLLYGYIEIGIGVYAFFFGLFYKLVDVGYVAMGSHLVEHKTWLLLLKGILSVGLLLGPTVLMGGTLPLVAAWLEKESTDAGRRSARFYATNSLGAVFGAGLAGFYLVHQFGLVLATQFAAVGNVLIGIIAVGVARYQSDTLFRLRPVTARTELGPEPDVPTSEEAGHAAARLRWGCVMVAITGGVSMGLEVLASRFLTLIFGASLQAFAVVLMAFILGIGLGSIVVSSPRFRRLQGENIAMILLLVAAAMIGILVMSIEQWVEWFRLARTGLSRTTVGYRYYQMLTAGMAMVVLGLPAALLGSVLPLWIRSVSDGSTVLGERVGRLLTWNTLGAVAGVLFTGFVLMPQLGLRGSFGFMAITLSVVGLGTAWMKQQRSVMTAASGLAVLLLTVSVTGGEGWRYTLSWGMFRIWETEGQERTLEERRRDIELIFYEDAADATVSVERDRDPAFRQLSLKINGKTDASTRGDLGTQHLMAHLPMMMRPKSKQVFVLGFGSGITAGALLGYPIDRLTIAENCEPVLRAAKWFEPWNRGVLTNRQTRVWNEDARTILKLSPQKYDVIICEPSNPWVAGVGSVFSEEFYKLAATRLTDGGVMAQWFHVYEMHDGIVSLVVNTFATVFPYMEIWDTGPGDIVMIGSKQPWPSSPAVYGKVFELEQPRKDLEALGLKTPAAVWARQMASQRTGFAIAGDVGVQSDEFPILEYEAPEAFFLGRTSELLFHYDERLYQSEIAPEEKRTALKNLDPAVVKQVFATYVSVNVDLQKYLFQRFGSLPSTNVNPYVGTAPRLCIFFPWKLASTEQVPVPAGSSSAFEDLMLAEALILNSPPSWKDGVSAIEDILRAQTTETKISTLMLGRFAVVAARACLRHHEYERAARIVSLGLQFEPQFAELGYLARLVERERTAGTKSASRN